jgi:hypothetical protein
VLATASSPSRTFRRLKRRWNAVESQVPVEAAVSAAILRNSQAARLPLQADYARSITTISP